MITYGNREIFTLLEFMFDIKKTKFEDWVIRPYLNKILSGTDYDEGYEKFLLTLFPTIGCEVGDVGCLLADRDHFPSLYVWIRYKRGFNWEYKIAESELPFFFNALDKNPKTASVEVKAFKAVVAFIGKNE